MLGISPNTYKLLSYTISKYSEQLPCECGPLSREFWYSANIKPEKLVVAALNPGLRSSPHRYFEIVCVYELE